MSQKTCMTLRLDPAIEELVAEAAHNKGSQRPPGYEPPSGKD
jgi:hypothetical protein